MEAIAAEIALYNPSGDTDERTHEVNTLAAIDPDSGGLKNSLHRVIVMTFLDQLVGPFPDMHNFCSTESSYHTLDSTYAVGSRFIPHKLC